MIISKEGEASFDTRLSQYLGVPVKSLCAVPVLCEKAINHGILLGVSEKTEQFSGLDSITKALSLLLTKWKKHKMYQQQKETLNNVMISCENLVTQTNTYEFARTLESYLSKIVNCERANVILIDPIFKKFARRLGNPPHQSLVMYSLQKGLAGATALARNHIICNNVPFDRRFCREIDDPQGTYTTSILSVPLIIRDKIDETFPKAVIQFIDSRDSEGFTEKHAKFCNQYISTIAKIHRIVKTTESINSIHEVSKRIDGSLIELLDTIEPQHTEDEGLKRNQHLFRNMIIPVMRKNR